MEAIRIEDPIDIVIGNDVAMEMVVDNEALVATEALNITNDCEDFDEQQERFAVRSISSAEEIVKDLEQISSCQQSYDAIMNRRVKECLKKRKQRENKEYRKRETEVAKQRMANKRSNPKYRELERQRDRERRALARKNSRFREKEKARDRLYRQKHRQGYRTSESTEHIGDFCSKAVAVVVERQEIIV
ncbi:zinc finger CCCH domain-containing protein 13-like [Mercenaria mercenaria]|uniref:zinc finger CCCH domain-containing protein 13-like n=1 Tax=Mercenaria mercenaria TaxID=6596 RepID=UPI001E1DBBF3|nr:zinc finger CCCH domain-containing protein 13-like [Mercenaria mercenaria]